jgi:hypothetical protein
VFHSSTGVERGFCGACGTTLTYNHAQRNEEIDFTLASLEEPAELAPQVHIWVQDKIAWVRIDDGLPQVRTVPQMGG